jgi:putative endonuclease
VSIAVAPPPPARKTLGDFGERLAARHLEAGGYCIAERNHRTREGEIDIIARRGDTLAFVEVRIRRGQRMGCAAESVTPAKAQRMFALAEAYTAGVAGLPQQQRIDVIAIDLSDDGRLTSLRHIENAVTGY